jgi:hypothetical protein
MSRIFKALAILGVPVMISMATHTPHAAAAQGSVKVGFLSCEVAGGVSFIFGSSRDLTCTFETSDKHQIEKYNGKVRKYGIDIGYLKSGVIIWGVVAPTSTVAPGALAGDYVGINATLAAGYGIGADALIGGYKNSIALQPLSVEGVQGLNIAAGVVGLTLRPAK